MNLACDLDNKKIKKGNAVLFCQLGMHRHYCGSGHFQLCKRRGMLSVSAVHCKLDDSGGYHVLWHCKDSAPGDCVHAVAA